jgi:DNA-binding transcriptional regulator YhcF (GntR family)
MPGISRSIGCGRGGRSLTVPVTLFVARNTIRRAVEDLRDRGVLETLHGRGTYVARPGG